MKWLTTYTELFPGNHPANGIPGERAMIHGLTEEQCSVILNEACRFKNMTRLVVFGSRAMGNHKRGSDVDLAVWGLDAKETRELKIRLNEYTNLPYQFDVIRFEPLKNPELNQNIIDFGKTIYKNP